MNESIDHAPDGAAKQRALVGLRRRRLLLRLVAEYVALLPRHPELRREIQSHIDDLLSLASRTRDHERQLVLDALKRWGLPGLTLDDLRDETMLSEWTLHAVLSELRQQTPALVGREKRAPVGGIGAPAYIYFLLDLPISQKVA